MLINERTNIIITYNELYLMTDKAKNKGLMFSKPQELVFHYDNAEKVMLHMFFVFYKIDVIFIMNNAIVDIKRNFKPFTLYQSKAPCNMIIELPKDYSESIIGDVVYYKK